MNRIPSPRVRRAAALFLAVTVAVTGGLAVQASTTSVSAYIGSEACAECHANLVGQETRTAHAGAFTDPLFAAEGGQTNSSCLQCHTVGYGTPTGFSSASLTPLLGGVQCESCHGAAASHAANPDDPIARPQLNLAAAVCGACHTGPMTPTFDEWQVSPHTNNWLVEAGVVQDMNAPATFDACGRCHSGSARLALLEGQPLLVGNANLGIVCATCHDPHQTNSNPAQLRNPLASTNDYFITASGVFTNQYQANINLCAQCHNHRGAVWTDTGSAPHRSLQYNMLLGTVGELASGLPPHSPASHGLLISNQCVGCHMQQRAYVSEAEPAVTGHTFTVNSYEVCQTCHANQGQALAQFVQADISNQVMQVKAALDLWATNKAPAALRTNYGALAWEYSTPGDLSAPGPGPSASEQGLISTNIQKARFDLYLVYHDGSYGVHNAPYSVTLLETAMNWVKNEIEGLPGGGQGAGTTNPLILEPPVPLLGAPTNSTTPLSAIADAYYGLVWDTNQVSPLSSGFITLKITPQATYTGALLLAGRNYPFSGKSISSAGLFTNYLISAASHLLTLRLQVDLSGGDQVQGTVNDVNANWISQVVAGRALSGANTNLQGKSFTLLIPPAAGSPFGSGYGAVNINASGMLQWTGGLADGSKVSQSTGLSKQGFWPLFASLYNGGGLAIGWMRFANGVDLTGQLVWIKEGGLAGYYTNAYALGITNSSFVGGSPYSAPVGNARILDFTNATVTFFGGGLSNTFANGFTLGPGDGVTPKDSHLTLSFTPSSGLFHGSTENPATGETLSFQGAVNQRDNDGAGFFTGRNQTGGVSMAPAN